MKYSSYWDDFFLLIVVEVHLIKAHVPSTVFIFCRLQKRLLSGEYAAFNEGESKQKREVLGKLIIIRDPEGKFNKRWNILGALTDIKIFIKK